MNFFLKPNTKTVFFVPVAVALVLRLIYHLLGINDFWGDSYHNVFISSATLDNNWVYTDYKGREVVWLPFYRYLVSIFMWVFQSRDIVIGHMVNVAIGSLSCGMVARLTARSSNNYYGLMAGLLLALLPWHVAYSHMNMPEILGSFFLLLAVYLESDKRYYWLIFIGFLGALTKNEVTLYMGALGVLLIWSRDWKRVFLLGSGAVMALLSWGLWNQSITGSFFWWISERSVGSGWDKLFYSSQPTYFGDWYVPLFSIIQVFPLVLLVPLLPRDWFRIIRQGENHQLAIVTILVLFNWLFVIGMNFNYFPSPDARYFIITLPLACASFGMWMFKKEVALKFGNRILLSVLLLSLIQWPVFHYLQYTLYPSMEMGKYIQRHKINNQNFWIDLPTTVYFAEIERRNSYSSEMIIPKIERDRNGFRATIADRLRQREIRFVVFQDVPYSYLGTVWPQLKENRAFTWYGITFEPVHQVKYESTDDGIDEQIKEYAVGGRSSSLWNLFY